MKLCDTCIYRNNVEQLKPCIIYRDNCEYYEKERMKKMTNEQVKAEIMQIYGVLSPSKQQALDMAIKALEQEPKIGRWEYVQYDNNPNIGNWHCSECRTIIPHMPEEIDNTPIYKWCPMCKVKIQEVEE